MITRSRPTRPARLATARAVLLGTAVMAAACAPAAARRADVDSGEPLRAAMDSLTSVIVYDIFSPPQASRVYAYASVAAYEAARHADPALRPLTGQLAGMGALPAPPAGAEHHWGVAAVRAFLVVGRQLTFSRDRMDTVRAHLDRQFANAGIPRAVLARSAAYGDTVGARILAWAATDGYLQSRGMPKYGVTRDPGRWIPTPPAYMDGVEPNWGTLRPFTLDSVAAFRPAPAVPFDTAPGSAYMRQAREVLETARTLSDEQRAIAAFWDCNPYVMHVQGHTMFATKKITPGGHWMAIASHVSRQAASPLPATAEAFARTAVALADGFIGAWEEKYRSAVLRPETVINRWMDEGWQPLLQTPPFPEYPSGHSVISTAAAEVLTDLYGDGHAFTDSTEVPFGLPVRSFPSFRAAAREAAMSRLYAGIHYRHAIEAGAVQGARIGAHVVARMRTRARAAQAR
jgi:membrane-associated phospholipid phosphatase